MNLQTEILHDRTNKILRLNVHTFQLIVEGVITIEGTYDQVRACALGLDFEGVDVGMHAMVMEDNNCAVFGINRTFMYTKPLTGYKPSKLHVVQ